MQTKQRITIVAGASLVAAMALMGCELIVDFDRSKIPVAGAVDGSLLEASAPDANGNGGTDANQTTDGPQTDGAPAEASVEASTPDAGDGGHDASDGSTDAPVEAAAPDTGADAANDAAPDAATDDGGDASDGSGE